MSSLIPSGSASGTGSMSLVAPVTNSNRTVTLPDADGIIMVSSAMPAFSAYVNTAQTITNASNTKIQNGVENFDTNSCYDSTTNYRFTPNVAGYYFVSVGLTLVASSSTTIVSTNVFKNGSSAVFSAQTPFNNGSYVTSTCSGIVYMNGTTDYIEQYCFQNSGGTLTVLTGRPDLNFFTAAVVRAA